MSEHEEGESLSRSPSVVEKPPTTPQKEPGPGCLANTHIFPADTSVLPGAYIGSDLKLIFELQNISMGK